MRQIRPEGSKSEGWAGWTLAGASPGALCQHSKPVEL